MLMGQNADVSKELVISFLDHSFPPIKWKPKGRVINIHATMPRVESTICLRIWQGCPQQLVSLLSPSFACHSLSAWPTGTCLPWHSYIIKKLNSIHVRIIYHHSTCQKKTWLYHLTQPMNQSGEPLLTTSKTTARCLARWHLRQIRVVSTARLWCRAGSTVQPCEVAALPIVDHLAGTPVRKI